MTTYKDCGVNVEEGEQVVAKIRDSVISTWDERVVSKFGDFAGIIDPPGGLLVASTDGVGTKTIAVLDTLQPQEAFRSLGHDIVNHCVNDILVKGAYPLFFLDYIASSKLNSDHVANFVTGVSEACKHVKCALLGGETAEMPDVYSPGHVDIVGTMIGTVSPNNLIVGNVLPTQHIIGLASNGPHTNGYSMIRKILKQLRPADVAPHRCYLDDIKKVQATGVPIHGLCHITGGGWQGNIKRILPAGTGVRIDIPRSHPESTFSRVQRTGGISDQEMLDTFNMGFGMLIFIDSCNVDKILQLFDNDYAQDLGSVINYSAFEISIV